VIIHRPVIARAGISGDVKPNVATPTVFSAIVDQSHRPQPLAANLYGGGHL
jgi:hypothetical protein